MKLGLSSLILALASLGALTLAQEDQDKAKEGAKPAAAAKTTEGGKPEPSETKPAEPKGEKAAEKPAAKPATAADFPIVYKKWQDVDKRLNELGTQYQLAQSSEERAVLRERYQRLVSESEMLLPQLRAAAEAAFAAEPGKDEDVKKILIGMMAYDYRRDDYDAVVQAGQKLLAAKVEDPVI